MQDAKRPDSIHLLQTTERPTPIFRNNNVAGAGDGAEDRAVDGAGYRAWDGLVDGTGDGVWDGVIDGAGH